MRTMKAAAMILLACLTFFSYGCTAGQRKEIYDELKLYAQTEILPKAKDAAIDYVEKKAKEQIEQQLIIQDQLLAKVAKVDPETGLEVKKTWRDFDADRNNELSAQELSALTLYIVKESSGKPGGTDTAKAAAGSAGIIGLALLTLYGVKKMRGGIPIPSGSKPV